MFGKVGRCCTQAIRARQYGNPDEVTLTRDIRISLHLMILFATTAPRRELSLDRQSAPLVLYTDASDVPHRPEGRWIVGAVPHRSKHHDDILHVMDRSSFCCSFLLAKGDLHGPAGDSGLPYSSQHLAHHPS